MLTKFKIGFLTFTFILISAVSSISGSTLPILLFPETDTSEDKVLAFFDLRDRETFIQITNTGVDLNTDGGVNSGVNLTLHIQIFNVDDNCNENNFFDVYTPADTHIYNMRNILTNDGNPSGVILPDNAYGIVSIGVLSDNGDFDQQTDSIIGNLRILDESGYEYRTNIASDTITGDLPGPGAQEITFNFNTEAGVILSDIVGITYAEGIDAPPGEIAAANILDVHTGWSVDIYNNNEVPQSCRNVVFACVDDDNPLLEELLEEVAGDSFNNFASSVAAFEYGINNAIPHSRGGELLCPGNITSEGFVNMRLETITRFNGLTRLFFIGYVGLNNGNGRGTFDSFWFQNGRFCSTQCGFG